MVKWRVIRISQDNQSRLRSECRELFLDHHPEMKGLTITDEFIVTKIIDFYLK